MCDTFCSGAYCCVIVSHPETLCEFCMISDRECSMSYESDYECDECPGCGDIICVGANGYCAACWQDRYGFDDYLYHDPVQLWTYC